MSSKAFLLQECENVRDLLENTLRHDYGVDSSRHFFDECSTRLGSLESEIAATLETDVSMLSTLGRFLSELAELICRIERSSLGEYSWPFVEELKRISSAVCRESTLYNSNSNPHVYVFAEGGLSSYAIYTEVGRPSFCQQRLLTIVFPKSLKNFVLLHPILGHELGHAIWQVSKHRMSLKTQVINHLTRIGGVFQDPDSTAAHLYSKSAPHEFQAAMAKYKGLNQATIFGKVDWGAWIEEILCDLIGLVMFGPGFVAAHCRLLYTVEPSGIQLGPRHPLVAWRVNMILRGAKLLGYDRLPRSGSATRDPVERFWKYLETFGKTDPWFDVLPDPQLADALRGIKSILTAHAPAAYPLPTEGRISALFEKLVRLLPPVGSIIGRDSKPKIVDIDFRHIIYAGWIATLHDGIPFKRINQLCEHAIMQQRAIQLSLRPKANT